jgi:hypothetical protein
MLHVAVVQLVAVDSTSAQVSGLLGNSVVLSSLTVAIDAARSGHINKEFFIKLPAKNDLVFRVLLVNGVELSAHLTKDYLSSVALSVSQVKTVHLKPKEGPVVASGLKLKLDFVVPTFTVDQKQSVEALESRYGALLERLKAPRRRHSHAPLLLSKRAGGSELLRPKGERNSLQQSADHGRAPERATMCWNKDEYCTVTKLLVRAGAPVMYGTPIVEVCFSDAAGSENEEPGYVAQDDSEAEEQEENKKEGAKDAHRVDTYKERTGSLTGYALTGLESSPALQRLEAEAPKKEAEEETGKTVVVKWMREEVGTVVDVHVRVDSV